MKQVYPPPVVSRITDGMEFYCIQIDASSPIGLYSSFQQLGMVGVPYTSDSKNEVCIFFDSQMVLKLKRGSRFQWIRNGDYILVHKPPVDAPPDYHTMPTVKLITDLKTLEAEYRVAQS